MVVVAVMSAVPTALCVSVTTAVPFTAVRTTTLVPLAPPPVSVPRVVVTVTAWSATSSVPRLTVITSSCGLGR